MNSPAVPFNNSIVGEQGTLVRAQIKSPNFSLAGQTGWAILKNGSAYFFNVTASGTITATKFVGTDFALTSLGAFFYSGPPALGNLFLSLAPAAGVNDGFGNAFAQGFKIYGASGQGLVINVAGGIASAQFPSGAAEEVTPGELVAFITASGPAEILRLFLNGPVGTTPNSDAVSVYLSSSAKDGSSPALGALIYNDSSGLPHNYITWGSKGIRLTSPYSGDTTSYQAERSSQILAGSITINTTALTDIFTVTLGIGTYIFEGQIVITPSAGGTAGFQIAGPTGSSGIIWEDILLGGAPYTNEGASYSDPAFAAQFNTPTLTTSKHRILFRGSVNLTAAGTFALIATEAGGASYVINSRVTFLHVFPVGP